MTVTGPVGWRERLELEARFGRAFAGALYKDYGSVIHRSTPFNRRRRLGGAACSISPSPRSSPTRRTTASPCV